MGYRSRPGERIEGDLCVCSATRTRCCEREARNRPGAVSTVTVMATRDVVPYQRPHELIDVCFSLVHSITPAKRPYKHRSDFSLPAGLSNEARWRVVDLRIRMDEAAITLFV
jgi:hypothetical protein